MRCIKKAILFIQKFGLNEFLCKVWSLIRNRIQSIQKLIGLYFYKHSDLYKNFINNKKDITLTKKVQEGISKNNEKSLYQLDIRKIKTSDTVFILGSGASINDLSTHAWDIIASNDSIGFNFWMVHEFVPTFYFFERQLHDDRWETLLKLFETRKKDYAKTKFFLEYKSWQPIEEKRPLSRIPDEIKQNIYLYAPYYLRSNNKYFVAANLIYSSLFRLNPLNTRGIILHRASVSALIYFCLLAGYKKIILVGVDLNNTEYFWELPTRDNYKIYPSNIQSGIFHATVDPAQNTGAIPIDEYIYLFNDILIKPRGVSLYVASDKSRLYPRINTFNF